MRALVPACALLVLIAAKPGAAAGARIVIWSEPIAAALSETATDGTCRGPSAGALDHGCAERALNHRRTPFVAVSLLDDIAFLVNRVTNVAVDEKISDNIKVEFIARTTDVVDQEVEARLYLKFEW